MTPRLVLGSTSPYRAGLLRRLVDHFEQCAPGTCEDPHPGEAPADRALRLAQAKAADAGAGMVDALVIGSDQVADLDGHVLDKPASFERARAQLQACAGREVYFHTALCLLDTRNGNRRSYLDRTRVRFRSLTPAEVDRYLAHDQPLDCAGSACR
jgi:septum formation protein